MMKPLFKCHNRLSKLTIPIQENHSTIKYSQLPRNSKHVIGAADSFETLSRNEQGKRNRRWSGALFRALRNPDPSPAYQYSILASRFRWKTSKMALLTNTAIKECAWSFSKTFDKTRSKNNSIVSFLWTCFVWGFPNGCFPHAQRYCSDIFIRIKNKFL